jgi:hypothetical protein
MRRGEWRCRERSHVIACLSHRRYCPLPILHHEPHNVAESAAFWNITSELVRAGRGFCRLPAADRRVRVQGWEAQLQDTLSFHRRNMAFDTFTARFRGACDHLSPSTQLAVQAQTESRLATSVVIETPRCQGAYGVRDLIHSVGNDTLLVVGMTASIVRRQHGSCGSPPPEWLSPLMSAVPFARAEAHLEWYRTYHPEWAVWAITLVTVYHKLLPFCAQPIVRPGQARKPPDWECATPNWAQQPPDLATVYDLALTSDARACAGGACRAAAAALDEFKALLLELTPVRAQLARALHALRREDLAKQKTLQALRLRWADLVKQQGGVQGALEDLAKKEGSGSSTLCSALEARQEHSQLGPALLRIAEGARAVASKLLASAHALEAVCVVPPRTPAMEAYNASVDVKPCKRCRADESDRTVGVRSV